MRLFSAIPLLFWVGTAAVAHLAHVWALVPAAVTPVEQSSEAALGVHPDRAICSAAAHLFTSDQPSPTSEWPTVSSPSAPLAASAPEAHSARFHQRILSAAQLSANPPPRRA